MIDSTQKLRLQICALMNDTEATLLSHAYENPSTRISLVWGTGINAALLLPQAGVSKEKFRQRPKEWLDATDTVVLNTEASMFGMGILPTTQVDVELDALSDHPGFQPLEQLTGGRYIGEIVRLYLMQGVRNGALFNGIVPRGLQTRSSLDSGLVADLEK